MLNLPAPVVRFLKKNPAWHAPRRMHDSAALCAPHSSSEARAYSAETKLLTHAAVLTKYTDAHTFPQGGSTLRFQQDNSSFTSQPRRRDGPGVPLRLACPAPPSFSPALASLP